ncbi:MAG: gliding motility-associated C-terminal domain-containing protein [Flavobacterium sp.]
MKITQGIVLFFILFAVKMSGQNVALYEQFNGRYDFTFVGNTLNERFNKNINDPDPPCEIKTFSDANLILAPGNTILKAYLYWAGSGTGDYSVKLNGTDVTASREFPIFVTNTDNTERWFFSAFADVTPIVQQHGAGNYVLSDLDLTGLINTSTPAEENTYCKNGTNFGGWVIVVVYQNNALPLNQLNLYDGLQYVPTEVNITLDNLNVIDNEGAKIGFVAWEGDPSLSDGEGLYINNDPLTNALNPEGNAFNGTYAPTGGSDLYNMDVDIYDIEGNIDVGDDSASIKLTSTADFVMISTIITKLNSQLPDATIDVTDVTKECNNRTIQVSYTVSNINSTDTLPGNIPVSVYANNTYISTFFTTAPIPIGGSQSGSVIVTIPAGIPQNFTLELRADDNNGASITTETDETNNAFSLPVSLWVSPVLQTPQDVTACDDGNGTGIFDFSAYEQSLKVNATDIVTFHTSQTDANTPANAISPANAYQSTSPNQQIFVRLQDENGCYSVASFRLVAVDCLFPDATVTLANLVQTCNSRIIQVQYTVRNLNSNDILPAGTPVAIYANGEFIDFTETTLDMPIGGSETENITLTIPADIPLDFDLMFVADDTGDGTGIVVEIDENNNSFTLPVSLWVSPELANPENLQLCNESFGFAVFDFSGYEESLKTAPTDIVTFHPSQQDADSGTSAITNTSQFTSTANPQQLFVRLEDVNGCYSTASFTLSTRQCPPETYNYVTPNGDSKNDTFFVKGLRNIFLNFKMSIYNRWGSLVWTGNNNTPDWDGIANEDKVGSQNTSVPTGTYYFVLELNDPAYPKPIVGWVYVTE